MALPPRMIGLACAVAAPLCWSVGGAVMRSIPASAWEMVFWRSIGHMLAFPILLWAVFGWRSLRDMRRAGWRSAVVTACMVGTFTFHVLAITTTTVANVLIVQSISPFLVVVAAALLLGERPGRAGWAVVALAFAGLLPVIGGSLLAGGGGGRLEGDLWALAVALGSATMVITVRGGAGFNLFPGTWFAAAIAAVIAAAIDPVLETSPGDAAILALLGIVQSTIGLAFFFTALRYLPAIEVSLITLLEPVLGPLWAWLFVGEEPPASTLAGGAVVLAALGVNAAVAARRYGTATVPANPP
ncbi:MAG: DMT family transporter [Alphaproteobacteria bacterium]|nr:DMT family transporter [Alphaproteobacteria bacterium]